MGWTFEQYDSTPAHQIKEALELWRLESEFEKNKTAG